MKTTGLSDTGPQGPRVASSCGRARGRVRLLLLDISVALVTEITRLPEPTPQLMSPSSVQIRLGFKRAKSTLISEIVRELVVRAVEQVVYLEGTCRMFARTSAAEWSRRMKRGRWCC